jgi:hypothetical protein
VLPLDDRQALRFTPEVAGRPTLIKGNSQLLFAGMGRLSENSVVDDTFTARRPPQSASRLAAAAAVADRGRIGVGRPDGRRPSLLTFVAGPLGLLYFLLERGLRRPMPYPFDQPRAKKSGRHRQ